MQNYNNPSQPQGGYGAPPPKKGMSTGVKILIAAVGLVVVVGFVLILVGVGGYFYFRRQAQPMSSDFPADASINAFYAGAEQRKSTGEVDDVRWLKLDGVKGVMFREAAPENSDSPQRLQWMGYRSYKGQLQLVNIMLASEGKYFARHEDAMYGILYSTKLSQ